MRSWRRSSDVKCAAKDLQEKRIEIFTGVDTTIIHLGDKTDRRSGNASNAIRCYESVCKNYL